MARPVGAKNKPKSNSEKAASMGRGRRPKGGVITGPTEVKEVAADAPEAAAAIGHNSTLTPDQRRALTLQAADKINPLMEKMRTITADIRNLYKAAKADGVPKKDIDFVLWLQKSEEEDVKGRFGRERLLLSFVWPHLADQADMFDGVNRMPAADRAFEEGKSAGMKGDDPKAPYHEGSEQGQAWLKGWHAGRDVNLGGISQMEVERDLRPRHLRSVPTPKDETESVH